MFLYVTEEKLFAQHFSQFQMRIEQGIITHVSGNCVSLILAFRISFVSGTPTSACM
jgi:hypothetical protein